MAKKTGETSTPEVKAKSTRTRKPKSAPGKSNGTPKTPLAAAAPGNVKTMPAPAEVKQMIQERAYFLFQSRGGQHGQDQSDWLKAEAEILGKRTA